MALLDHQTLLVTGGTGSFGRHFIRHVLEKHQPKKVIVFSRDELKQHEMRQAFPESTYPQIRYFLGDVRDRDRLQRAFDGVDIVVHAAALKQVPAAEYNPLEAIKTNVLGAANVIDAAIDRGVQRVVALSTDKAANPINLYGATKLCADKLFVAGNHYVGPRPTRFGVVRYGNVLGSRGSVVPHFLKHRAAGTLPITDARMTRFWITLDQAVALVLQSVETMQGGEIYVPKIPSMGIADLARAIGPDCALEEVGIRPGEKLHEIMISEDDARHTLEFDDHYRILPEFSGVAAALDAYSSAHGGRPCPEGFSYRSDTNTQWLTRTDLRALVGLDPDEAPQAHEHDALALHGGPPVRSRLLPYGRQTIEGDDIAAAVTTLQSGWLTTGPQVEAFEDAFAAFVDAEHAVAVSSGTGALHAAYHALGIGASDEVIVPAITFAATANAVRYVGGTPVFADVEPDTLLLDPADVARKITPNTRAIVAVDYAGQPCDYAALRRLADDHDLALVADACHALGASYQGTPVGHLADLSTFSLHPVKPITTGEGGVVTTDRADWAERMQRFRNHGIDRDFRARQADGGWTYGIAELGYNYRLTDVQCAVGLAQLHKLPRWIERRRAIAQRYDEAFAALPFVQPLTLHADRDHAYHLYPVLLDLDVLDADRRTVFEALQAEGISVNVHYLPVYWHPYYRDTLGIEPGRCPAAEAAYERLLTLPLFPAMTGQDVEDVVTAVRKVLRHYAADVPALS